MARGHLTRSPSGHLTRQAGRSPDSASGSTFTLADGLADFLVSGRARGLSPKTLDWYRMIGERFAAFRTSRGADPALSGIAFSFPPGPPCMLPPGPPCIPGYARTTIETAGGLVVIDTLQSPAGPTTRFALPNLAVISIHPPNPCRARTVGTTVVFTPILSPGPPD